jgi:hypothetical protein
MNVNIGYCDSKGDWPERHGDKIIDFFPTVMVAKSIINQHSLAAGKEAVMMK